MNTAQCDHCTVSGAATHRQHRLQLHGVDPLAGSLAREALRDVLRHLRLGHGLAAPQNVVLDALHEVVWEVLRQAAHYTVSQVKVFKHCIIAATDCGHSLP
jgi:hypothetical protein